MAAEGKIPMLGFKGLAIKFVTLFGFSPNDVAVATAPIYITVYGSSASIITASGSSASIITASGEGGDA